MRILLSRRRLLASAAMAAAATGLQGVPSRPAQAAEPIRLAAERRTLDINGKPASVFGIRRPDGRAGIDLDPGQRFSVLLENRVAGCFTATTCSTWRPA